MKSAYRTSNVYIIVLPVNLINSSAYHVYEKTGNIDQSMVRLVMWYYDLDSHLEVNSSPCHYLCCLLP